MRLIDADELYLGKFVEPRTEWNQGWNDALDAATTQAPAVDAVPVVHGYWDDSGRYRFPGGSLAVRCTECGCALTASEFKLNRWNYCPVCGAKMDGDGKI